MEFVNSEDTFYNSLDIADPGSYGTVLQLVAPRNPRNRQPGEAGRV